MAKSKKASNSPDVAEQPVRANAATREHTRSPSFVSLYVNDVQLQTTPWDVRLTLGQIENVDVAENRAYITVLADVRLSPQHAKKLGEVLNGQIKNYEQNFGTIPQPKD